MDKVDSIIARARHWQLFVVMLLPMVVAYSLYFPSMSLDPVTNPEQSFALLEDSFIKMMLVSLFGYMLLYLWIWVIGRVCNSSLPRISRRKDGLFNFSVPFALCYLPIATIAFPKLVATEGAHWSAALIIPLHIAASFMLFYAMIFAARSVASLGQNRRAGFGRSFLFFMGIMYFPIGVWIIQPCLNAAFADTQSRRQVPGPG